jgi:3-dehydroquinate synthase
MSERVLLDVALGERAYPIAIGAGLLREPGALAERVRGRHVLVVSNDTVAPLYLERVRALLDGREVGVHVLRDGESFKTLESCGAVFESLARMRASRDATLVALGGGVVGDLTGFAAACWMRGVDFVQIPTTLLAMVDSSVGGKTGVNLAHGKNLVGAFHQPRAVLADVETLATLPDREYAAGLAEVVKYGAIADAGFFAWLEANAAALARRDAAALIRAIEVSCRMKAAIVARDEREEGERALLNFGHTFGHALEAATGYGGALNHGEAVAIGMVLAARLSVALGWSPDADTARLRALLEAFALPTQVPSGHAATALLDLMRLDKKAASGKLKLILWRGIGRAEIASGVPDDAIIEVLAR